MKSITFNMMRQLLSQVPKGRGRLALATFLAAAASGASVALMGVSAWLITRASEHPEVAYLLVAVVGVRFFGISRGVFRYLERLFGHELALQMQSALRIKTYQKLAKTTLLGARRGDLLNRVISDVAAVQDLIVRVVVPFASAGIVMITTTVLLGRFSFTSASVLFITAVLAGVVLPWITQRLSLKYDKQAIPARGVLADRVHEISRTASDLVAYDSWQTELDRLLETDQELVKIEEHAAWIRGLASAGQIIAAGIAVISAIFIGGQALAEGQLSGPLLTVLVLTPLAMHEIFMEFTSAAQSYTRIKTSLLRLETVLAADPIGCGDIVPIPSAQAFLELNHLDIGWPNQKQPVVKDLSLRINPGQKVALTGASGIGKTTLAATIMGMIPPKSGTIHTAGRIGYLAQDAHIFHTTVAENVRIGNKDATPEQISRALLGAGLSIDPERIIGEAGSTISGGEARRLAFARVLVGERDLFILDEPTESLDTETANALMKDLWAATANQPILVITHDPEVVKVCDHVVKLSANISEPATGSLLR